jgi:hypothetical protein
MNTMPIDMHPLDFLASIYADDAILEHTELMWAAYCHGSLALGEQENATEEPEEAYQCPFCERQEAMTALVQLTWVGDDACTCQCDLSCQHCPFTMTVYGIVRDPCPEGQPRGELRMEPFAIAGVRGGQG